MKKSILTVLTVLCSIIISSSVWGQAPEKFNYQAVLRDNGNVMVSESVNVRFTILDGSASGTNVYQETQFLTTDQYGRVNCAVGGGTVVSGDFSTIDWGNGGKYLQVEIDSGTGFEDLGASQLLSVPYALQAGELDNAFEGWAFDGNSVTGTDFIGTTNNQILRFKVNNQAAGFISPNPFTAPLNTAAWNNAYGGEALINLTTGRSNTGVGNNALKLNTTGSLNTGIGVLALGSNVTGIDNSALGVLADVGLPGLTNATAIGARSFVEQSNSIILGSIDGVNSATANTRVGIGTTEPRQALHVEGSVRVNDSLIFSGGNMNIRQQGLAMEIHALAITPSSSFSGAAALGLTNMPWGHLYVERIEGRDDGLEAGNTLVIKTPTIVEMSGGGTVGNKSGFMIKNTNNSTPTSINFQVGASSNNLYLYKADDALIGTFNGTTGAYSSTSDERLKTNFQEVESTLENLMKLKPLTYTYINNSDNDRRHIGFKAQEVEKLFPTLVNSPKNADSDSEEGVYTMDYSGFGVIAVKAIQEQQVEIETLKEQNESLQNQIEEIKKQLELLAK